MDVDLDVDVDVDVAVTVVVVEADLLALIICWMSLTSLMPWYSRVTLRWFLSSAPGFILWKCVRWLRSV